MSEKLQFPNVTLICIDCLNSNRAIAVLEKCKSVCDFAEVKFLSSIPSTYQHHIKIKPLNSLIAYSIFMLTKAIDYIDTEKVLICQRDGFIINASSWEDKWNIYDYIAPLFVQYPIVGSGGFSLRSRALMESVTKTVPEWDWTQKEAEKIQDQMGMYEDGITSLTQFNSRFKFAPPEEACKFAAGGNPAPRYYVEKPFGFHGVLANISHETGFVSPVCSHENNPNCGCSTEHINFLQQNEK